MFCHAFWEFAPSSSEFKGWVDFLLYCFSPHCNRMLPSLCPRAHSLRVACPWVSPWPHSHCRSRTYLRIVTLETTSTWNPRQMLCCHRILPTKGRGEATWTPYQTTPNQTMPLSTEVLAYRLWRGHVVTWQPSSRQPEGNTLLKPHPWLSPHWGCGAD